MTLPIGREFETKQNNVFYFQYLAHTKPFRKENNSIFSTFEDTWAWEHFLVAILALSSVELRHLTELSTGATQARYNVFSLHAHQNVWSRVGMFFLMFSASLKRELKKNTFRWITSLTTW